MADDTIKQWEFDVAADQAALKRLGDAGVVKPDDLGAGRADVGKISGMMERAGFDDEDTRQGVAEKTVRDNQFLQDAQGPAQPQVQSQEQEPAQPQDRLSQLQDQLNQEQKQAAEWKQHYHNTANKLGDVRKRLQELEHIGNSNVQPVVPQYQQPMMPQGQYTDEPVTQQAAMNLLLAQSQAFGQQLAAAKEESRKEAINIARGLQGYTLSSSEEADLQERHPWLLSLQPGQREKAMMELAGNKVPKSPSTQSRANARTDTAQAMGQARTFQYIEPSQQGSPQELQAQSTGDMVQGKNIAEIREALNKPGGSVEAEQLLAKMGAGPVDDSDQRGTKRN